MRKVKYIQSQTHVFRMYTLNAQQPLGPGSEPLRTFVYCVYPIALRACSRHRACISFSPCPVSCFLGFHLVSWVLGFLVFWMLGVLVSRFLGFLVSRFLGFWVSWLLGFLASWFLGSLVSWLLGFLISWFLGCLVSFFLD